MKISVIVPVYNGEKFLDETISSLIQQPFHDIEVILINDGSTDDSLKICKKYASQDNRIILVDKNNEGISQTRNLGLEIATGEYISFIDQDDKIKTNIYINFTEKLSRDDDWIIGGKEMHLIDEEDRVVKSVQYIYSSERITDYGDILCSAYNVKRDECMMHIWNCLYKKFIIDRYDIRFNTTLKFGHEDSLFNIEYAAKCKKIRFIDTIMYCYFRRAKLSTSLKDNPLYLKDFEEYCRVTRNAFSLNEQDPAAKSLSYTYFLRLGISLFSQYSLKCEKEIRNQDISDIFNISKLYAGSHLVNDKGIQSTFLNIFLNIISLFMKIRMKNIAVLLIDIVKK